MGDATTGQPPLPLPPAPDGGAGRVGRALAAEFQGNCRRRRAGFGAEKHLILAQAPWKWRLSRAVKVKDVMLVLEKWVE